MAVSVESKMRMFKVYERFNRIRASNSTASGNKNSSNVSLVYGEPYAVGTNAAVATEEEVILTNTPIGTLDKVTIYDTKNYAKPGSGWNSTTTFTTYTTIEEILAATPSTGAYIFLGKKGTTANRDRYGVGIGTVSFQLWGNSLNIWHEGEITVSDGSYTSTRSGLYDALTTWQPSGGPWDDIASNMLMFRIDDGAGSTYLVICPSVFFEGTTSSATSGLRVVYDVSDKGLTYSQPGRLIIEEVVSNLVEE